MRSRAIQGLLSMEGQKLEDEEGILGHDILENPEHAFRPGNGQLHGGERLI